MSKKTLRDGRDDVDKEKLEQLVAAASFICESLDSLSRCTPKVVALQMQLEELRKDLSAKLYSTNEMNIITDQKKRAPLPIKTNTNSDSTRSLSMPYSVTLPSQNEQELSEDADKASGERIHSLLQQQKVSYFYDGHLMPMCPLIYLSI